MIIMFVLESRNPYRIGPSYYVEARFDTYSDATDWFDKNSARLCEELNLDPSDFRITEEN